MRQSRPSMGWFGACAAMLVVALTTAPAAGYVEVPYSLGRIVREAKTIVLMRAEKIDRERNLIIYTKVQDLKGKHPADVIRHNIGKSGFHPREWQTIMETVDVGTPAVFFHNGSASETCIDNYWYQAYPGGDWWNMSHAEPYLLRSYAGKPEKLAESITRMLAGEEVVVTCMVDGDKNALQFRTARIQRLRAGLRIQDYDPKRDLVGWGNEEFQRITGMPGFALHGTLSRVDPGAWGIAAADFDGDGHDDLCLYGEEKVLLVRSAGKMMEDVSIPYTGGARAVAWGDYNGDGRPDLLLATPAGPKLFTNAGGGRFNDDSDRLPEEPYYNMTAAAWIDADGDGRLDILFSNGFLGLRLYQNSPSEAGLFEDATDKFRLGLAGVGGHVKGDHLSVADVNGDGRQDFLYSAGAGLLAINTPEGFVEASDAGLAFTPGKIAPVWGDYDGDGHIDLFVPQAVGSKLFRNDGRGRFVDVTAQAGELGAPLGHAVSAAFASFTGTGRLDLLIGSIKGPNRVLRNNGDGTFTDATEEFGLHSRIFNSRAVCAFDMNGDGVLDLAFNNEGQEPAILVSETSRIPSLKAESK